MTVVIAVDSDVLKNEKCCKGYNKVGTYNHPITSERVKYIGFAFPLDPMVIELMTEEQVRQALCAVLLARLDNEQICN